jgi:glycosyltransferase involved in cell wall biosynthesis
LIKEPQKVSEVRVCVGVPVFNGGEHLRRALSSIRDQTHINIEVNISDNASDDETESICREFASMDARFRYVRQSKNIGAVANFKLLVAAATSPFFVFLAADDSWEPSFIE